MKNELMKVWRSVVGYEGIYEVSNYGDIKSLPRPVVLGFGNCYFKSERVMKSKVEKNGYRRIKLCKDGISKYFNVHRLVAIAFLPNPENKKTVNHKDSNRSNNILTNLEWATNSENQIHSFKQGRINLGAKKKTSKEQNVVIVALVSNGWKQWKVARIFNVSQATISNIVKQAI